MHTGPANANPTNGGHPSRTRRWWLVGAVLIAIAAVAVIAVVVMAGRKVPGQPQAASLPGLPDQSLLTSSMRQQPVPGWHTSATELGLPPGTWVKPIGNVGDRGSFLGIDDDGWWVVGIDVSDGHRLFAPVRLGAEDDAEGFACVVNGPTMVLCLRRDRDVTKPAHAWVVNTERGSLIFDGPTDLQLPPTKDHPTLRQVGDYAVATMADDGVHGVGEHAELTWFVPGSGLLRVDAERDRDVAPPTLGVQTSYATPDVVFAVADGTVVTPSVPANQHLRSAIAYPNGLGYEYRTNDFTSTGVVLFDNAGKELSRPAAANGLLIGSLDVPMVETESNDHVYTLDGRPLTEMAERVLMPHAHLIGTKLLVSTDEPRRMWQQYDLRTGTPGKTCDIKTFDYGYIGSDGAVTITLGADSLVEATDLATCETLWTIPSSTDETIKDVWRVNTTLIQRANDELFSLVAPR